MGDTKKCGIKCTTQIFLIQRMAESRPPGELVPSTW